MSTLFIQGDARRLPLAARSVHCIIDSPPYWGLRDYGLAPSVWGGDVCCQHEWGGLLKRHRGGPQGSTGERVTRDTSAQLATADVVSGSFCQKCSAWLGCLGLEPTPELFIEHLVLVYREAHRVLRDDGTLWLNIGDSYNTDSATRKSGKENFSKTWDQSQTASRGGLRRSAAKCGDRKNKDLVGIPWMLAFALRADGWYLRQEIIWAKPNPMPESVRDRCTKAHESVFLLTKSQRYFYDADAIREPVTSTGGASFGKQDHDAAGTMAQSRKLRDPSERNNPLGRNKRSVWHISTQSCPEAHFATFPKKLVIPMVKAGTSEKGCCPTCGAPWKRVVEKIARPAMVDYEGKNLATDPQHSARRMAANTRAARLAGGSHDNPFPPKLTTHWLPSCKCPSHEPIPCTVLDNFSGAGTTAIVADRLGRHGIGVEAKRDYIDIAMRRLAHDRERRHEKARSKRVRRPKGEMTLFGPEAAA